MDFILQKMAQHCIERYGSPLYIIEEKKLEASFERFLNAFSHLQQDLIVAYSYKTNSLECVIRKFHELGAWAEITSSIELAIADYVKIPKERIIYNGCLKNSKELAFACQKGIYIFLDNEHELFRLEKIVRELGLSNYQIGMRVKFSSLESNWSKFGFDVESGQATTIAKYIHNSELFKLTGLHFHPKSNIGNIQVYEKSINRFARLVQDFVDQKIIDLRYLDVGSGFASAYPKPKTATNWEPPSPSEYADVLKKAFSFLPKETKLIVEPGRVLVSNSMTLLTRIIALKKDQTRNVAIADGAINMIPGRDIYRYRVRHVSAKDDLFSNYDIYGSLMEDNDLIASNIKMPNLQVGDVIAVFDVGAYELGRSYSWNIGLPPVVMIKKNGELSLIRRRETLKDIWKTSAMGNSTND